MELKNGLVVSELEMKAKENSNADDQKLADIQKIVGREMVICFSFQRVPAGAGFEMFGNTLIGVDPQLIPIFTKFIRGVADNMDQRYSLATTDLNGQKDTPN